jgi:antitoxin HicB
MKTTDSVSTMSEAWYKLTIRPCPDGDVWLVTCEAFPEVATFGESIEETSVNGRNAIEEAIAGRIADGEEIPPSDDPPGGTEENEG